MALPRLPLPPMLLSNEPGTWAHDTMSRRVRTEILGREVLEANAELLETMPEARAELERQVRSKVCRRITTIAAILGGKGDWKGVEGASGQALDASDAPPNGGGALHERKVGTRRVARTPPGAFEKAWLLSSIAQEYL